MVLVVVSAGGLGGCLGDGGGGAGVNVMSLMAFYLENQIRKSLLLMA